MKHLLRVLAFENYKALRSRLVQVALVASVLAAAGGAWLAHRGVGLTVAVHADQAITGYTVLAGGAGLGSVVAMLFVLIYTSNAVARERSEGTLKYGLTAGVPRTWFFLGKLGGQVLVTLVLLVAAGLVALALAAWLRGFGDVPATPPFPAALLWRLVWTSALLALVASVCLTSLAYFFSTVFSSSATALGLSVGLVLLGSVTAAIWQGFARVWPGMFVSFQSKALVDASQAFAYSELPRGPLLLGLGLSIVYALVLATIATIIGVRRDVVAE